jgi:hypothetical protein
MLGAQPTRKTNPALTSRAHELPPLPDRLLAELVPESSAMPTPETGMRLQENERERHVFTVARVSSGQLGPAGCATERMSKQT